ncbi:helix-turn-helix transcriptional regulator [Gemella sanguinis]|uniref:helix-turn-helix domain-containing protein n=1 Tax=Gemella sanguinis TaxID=84135 RepID=UPI00352C5CEF
MNDINKKNVGTRIKQIRLNKGYTLESFGKLFGASKGNVQQWENGVSLPNKERLATISKIADMTVNELLYGNTEKDIEELYQALIKLPKGEIINLMMKVAIEFENSGEKEC